MKCAIQSEKPRIRIGYSVGKLTVTAPTKERKNGYIIWQCQCECGKVVCLDTRTLQRGTVTSCGCDRIVQPGQKDISGKRFGKLIAVEPTEQRANGTVVWRCKCDCGGEIMASVHQLTSGYRRSCGCLSHPPLKDFVGKQFGALTVIGYAGKTNGMHRWRCKCDCGNETIVGQTLLQSGKTKSCGCRRAAICRENLRLSEGTSVTLLERVKNHMNPRNTSGVTGVSLNRASGKWIAQIGFKGKTYHLGSFENKREAAAVRGLNEWMHNDFIRRYYADILNYADILTEKSEETADKNIS